jgi:hypothetical protein
MYAASYHTSENGCTVYAAAQFFAVGGKLNLRKDM